MFFGMDRRIYGLFVKHLIVDKNAAKNRLFSLKILRGKFRMCHAHWLTLIPDIIGSAIEFMKNYEFNKCCSESVVLGGRESLSAPVSRETED